MWSRALSLGVSKPTTWLAAQSKAHALHHGLGIHRHLSEKWKKKNISVKEICKILEVHGWIIFLTNDYYLKVTSYIQLQSTKPATVVKLGQVCQTHFFCF